MPSIADPKPPSRLRFGLPAWPVWLGHRLGRTGPRIHVYRAARGGLLIRLHRATLPHDADCQPMPVFRVMRREDRANDREVPS